jgi:hypothetical protein
MATLQIRKKSSKTWVHIPSDADTFILSKFYCKTDSDIFKIVEESGSSRKEYTFDNITVYDDTAGGTMETFASSQALMIRLEALRYVGFNRDGDIPTSYVESVVAGTNVTVDNTDPLNPIVSATGGSATLGLIKIVDKAGDFFTNLATASAYIRTFTSATITNESFSNGTFWFTVPNGSSFDLLIGFLAIGGSKASIIDELGLITTFGGYAFYPNSGNHVLGDCTFGASSFQSANCNVVLGNCTFGNGCFAGFTGIVKTRNILLSATGNNFGTSASGRFEIYGTIGTTTGNDYANFFPTNTAVIWAPKSMQTNNGGGIEGDLARAQTNGAKLFFGYAEGGSAGAPLTRQEFSFTSSQDFTLSSTPSAIYAVFVNGQELNSSQYSFVTTTLTIADTLESGDKINIIYTPVVAGVLDYYTKAEIDAFDYESNHAEFIEVNDLTDLPTPVSGVITLVANYTYLFLKHIDLLGSRLVCGQNTVIVGWSSENCSISSTGLSGATALITSTYSLPIRSISFTHALVFDLQGDITTTALDWFGVNLLNCTSGGTIKDYANFVMSDCAFLNSGGFNFDGTIGTIGFSNSLFNTATGTTAINILSTCTVSRRLRIIYSSFVIGSGETGVNFSTSATVSDEKYILDTINFSGGGTYTSGVLNTSNKALFVNCVGIANTATRGFMYMINNGTDTTIGGGNVNVWVKAQGTTIADTANSKFNHASNRLTYTGAFNQSFLVTANTAVRSGSTNQNISIGIAKNGTILANSEMTIRTSTSNQEHPGSTQYVIDLVANDYLELFVKNSQSPDVRVSDLNFSVIKIPS